MTNHKSKDYKLTAVEYYLTEDISQEQVCRIFKCSPRSLMRWVKKYEEEGKIKQNEVKFILDEIKKDKTITMEDLLAKIQHKYPNFDITRYT